LVDLAGRSDDELMKLLRHSPMKRPKIEYLRRNFTIALANADATVDPH
jgi:epoxyqueuosine reductase QueG